MMKINSLQGIKQDKQQLQIQQFTSMPNLPQQKKPKLPKLDEYEIIKTLGEGLTSKVHLARNTMNNKLVALKCLKDRGVFDKTIQAEIYSLLELKHENILKLHKKVDNIKGTYLVLELAGGGELFDFIFHTGPFSEEVCRYYFHQLINALEYCHGQSWAHRDIKPENMLFDNNFKLKLADFGFARLMNTSKLSTLCGTQQYMAPELLRGRQYNGKQVDLFAAGMCLFIMYSGTQPFARALKSDQIYSYLCKNKNKLFWHIHSKQKSRKDFFSDDFKNLIVQMLKYKPQERLNIQQIKSHRWFNGPKPTDQQVQQEFKMRLQQVRIEQEKERLKKIRNLKNQQVNMCYGGQQMFRGISNELQTLFDTKEKQKTLDTDFKGWNKKDRQLEYFEEGGSGLNSYFIRINELDLLEFLLCVLQKDDFCEKIVLDDKSFKLNCFVKSREGVVKLSLTICKYRKDEDIKVIEFIKQEGNQLNYFQKCKEIKEKFLAPLEEHHDKQ